MIRPSFLRDIMSRKAFDGGTPPPFKPNIQRELETL